MAKASFKILDRGNPIGSATFYGPSRGSAESLGRRVLRSMAIGSGRAGNRKRRNAPRRRPRRRNRRRGRR